MHHPLKDQQRAYYDTSGILTSATTRHHMQALGKQSACQHMLVYLNGVTWTRGEETDQFAMELVLALRTGVHLLLAHEMPVAAALPEDSERHGIEFGELFADPRGCTPPHLLNAGIYGSIVSLFHLGTSFSYVAGSK